MPRAAAFLRFAITFTLIAFSGSMPGHAQTMPTLRVAMIPIETAAAVYYAQENGYFAKAGLTVEITQSASTPALASAVLAGTYDISYATVPTLATAHAKGVPFVILVPGIANSKKHFGGAIMVAENSTLRSGKDFNGQTLGTAGLNTIGEYLPRAWIDKNGGDSTTVKFVEIPMSAMADAIAAGRIAGAYFSEPFVTDAERRHLARILTAGADAITPNEFIPTGWFATAEWAKAHPDVVTRFQRAMNQAAAWADANPTKVVPIMAKEFKANSELVGLARRSYYPLHMSAADIQPWIDATAKYAGFPTFKAEELIYTPAR